MDVRRAGLIFLSLIAAVWPAWTVPTFWDDTPDPVLVENLLDDLGDEALLAQVFLVGYLNEDGGPSAALLRWVQERRVGGVKIFSRNITGLEQIARDVARLQTLALQDAHGIPLFIATDQEGGWVRHIRPGTSESAGNLALGASALPADAYRTGYLIGLEMKALGVNMNFAPTIDVYSNPGAEVIGPRAFSSDPVTTGLLGLAYFHGMEDAGVISTAKHFPGHGDANTDSHGELPVIPVDMETLWARDLVPYRFLVREGLPAVMSGHLAFPRILGDATPSSLSHALMTDLLRDRLGFQGIAITDDMEMVGALRGQIDVAAGSLQALAAGNDVILLSHDAVSQEAVWTALLSHMRQDVAFRARVRQAVGRILTIKLRYFKGERGFPLVPGPDAASAVPAKEARDFWFDQAARAVTLIRAKAFPYPPEQSGRTLIVSPSTEFREEGLARYPRSTVVPVESFPAPGQTAETLGRSYDAIIFHLATSQFDRGTLQALQKLEGYGGRLIVVATYSPVYLDNMPWVGTALAVYGNTRDSFRAGLAALAGDFRPTGKLPIGFMGS